jgi:hypothetical protein
MFSKAKREQLHIEMNEQDGMKFLGKRQKKTIIPKWMEDL